jgi:hypothetical protein
LERSCQETRLEIGEELSGDKIGDWRAAVRRWEIRPEVGKELSGYKTGDFR